MIEGLTSRSSSDLIEKAPPPEESPEDGAVEDEGVGLLDLAESSLRSKISSILFPHLRYFAYFIARGVLARDNTSNSSSPDVAILANVLSRKSRYHVGVLIAHRYNTLRISNINHYSDSTVSDHYY